MRARGSKNDRERVEAPQDTGAAQPWYSAAMKILHVEAGRHLYGGAMQVLLLLRGLADAGDVENVLLCAQGSALADAARAGGVQVRTVPLRGDLDFAALWRVRRVIRAERPQIVHLHSRRGADTLGALAALWTGARVVLSRRVDNPEPPWAVALKYRLYDHVIAISSAIEALLIREGVRPDKITRVRDAIDPAPWREAEPRARLAREFSLDPDAPIVAMVAQFIPRKGHDTLLDALPAVIEQHPRVQVLLFGKGREQERIQRRVRAEGFSHHVFFPGFRDDLPRWLGALDLLVHPAAREGLGVALLQAACAGTPIVACDAGGIGEVVRHGETGLLVPVAEPRALAQAMSLMLSQPNVAAGMAAGARRRAQEVFSVAAMAAAHRRVYAALVPDTGSAPREET